MSIDASENSATDKAFDSSGSALNEFGRPKNSAKGSYEESFAGSAKALSEVAPELKPIMLDGQSALAMQAANAVLLASGTATLEAMLYKKPMVVGYKLNPKSYWIFNTFFTFNIKYFSLPNLLADAPLVPEFLQAECNPDALADALFDMLIGDNSKLIERFYTIHQNIRLDASKQAAKAVTELLDAN